MPPIGYFDNSLFDRTIHTIQNSARMGKSVDLRCGCVEKIHTTPVAPPFSAGGRRLCRRQLPADASDRNARAVVQRIRISGKRSRREKGGRTRSETGSVYGTKTRAFPLRRHRPTARGPPSVCRRTCRQTRTQSFAKIRRRTKGRATVRLTNGFIRTASEAPLPLRRSKPEVSAASAGQAAFRHENTEIGIRSPFGCGRTDKGSGRWAGRRYRDAANLRLRRGNVE